MKTNSQKKADPEQNSAFNMYDIVFADLIDTFVLPNAVYLLTLDSIQTSTRNQCSAIPTSPVRRFKGFASSVVTP